MQDLTRDGKNLGAVRSHYPVSAIGLNQRGSPHRGISTFDHDLLIKEGCLNFSYKISGSFSRFHGNPPVWTDQHWHQFSVELELASTQSPGDMYGVDMVEMQQLLQGFIDRIPDSVNDLPGCKSGTTEALCGYFAGVRSWISDPQVTVRSVSVSECPERVTTLELEG